MLVIADTSPINYLLLIRHATLLPALYTRVIIPLAVQAELQDPATPLVVRTWVAHPPAWFEIRPSQQTLPSTEMPDLGDGEREAIVLAQELHADFLLIDEGDGRREAHRRALARLQATTFRARPELFQHLLARDAARKQLHAGRSSRGDTAYRSTTR